MRGLSSQLTLLTIHSTCLFRPAIGVAGPEILGVRIGKQSLEIHKNTETFFTVFGRNLHPYGYFLSTTDRCEDSEKSDILDKMVIQLKTVAIFQTAVRLHAPDGVAFSEKHPTFQVCHRNSTSLNKMLLQVTAPRSEGLSATWLTMVICCFTLIVSAYCSGANFAYMRMSINDMALIMENGEEPHKTHVRKIFKYRRQSNWLICTMAATNILVNTVFTNGISSLLQEHRYGYVLKYIVPTAMIVLLGEILPQSVCNRAGLQLAAKTRHLTLLLFIICAPVAYPLSRVIDYVLGREVREIYSEEKLKALIKIQSKKMEEAAQEDILARIADFPKKTVQDMMTPMEDAFVLSGGDTLDLKLLVTILEKGYTRIPVFEEHNKLNISTVLNVKDLATMTIDRKCTVEEVVSRANDIRSQMRFVLASQKGEAVMQEMMKGEHHLCGVIRFLYGRYKVVGLITFEDVIEEVFGDIEDDSDKMWNSHRAGIHKDQQTLEWFRQTDEERGPCLNVNAMLKLIQSIFAVCPLFASLGYDILRMKQLLDVKRLKFADEDEVIKADNSKKVLIFFSGTISVRSGKTTMYMLDATRADFRPYVWGKSLIRRLFKKRLHALSCLGEPLGRRITPVFADIRCLTRAGYYEISSLDILNGLRESDEVGYDYLQQYNKSSSGTNDDNDITTARIPVKKNSLTDKTQASRSCELTPKHSKEMLRSVDGATSPRGSERSSEKADLITITAREPLVHPGPPSQGQKQVTEISRTVEEISSEAAQLNTNDTNKKQAAVMVEKSVSKEPDPKSKVAVVQRRKKSSHLDNPSNAKKVRLESKTQMDSEGASEDGDDRPVDNRRRFPRRKRMAFLHFRRRLR